MTTMSRGTARNLAYKVGRQARIEGLTVKDANVRLAYKLRWLRREQYDDALLDECERGWRAEDSLRDSSLSAFECPTCKDEQYRGVRTPHVCTNGVEA